LRFYLIKCALICIIDKVWEANTFHSSFNLILQMCVLSRQVTAVSQELQEMTRLLKPLFYNPSTLLIPCAVTPPPSVSSHSCSPAPPLPTQHALVGCSEEQNPPPVHVPEPPSPQLSTSKVFQGEFDPLQSSRSISPHYSPPFSHQISPAHLVSYRSAPPSLNTSPHDHTVVPHLCSSSSIPSLSSSCHPSSITPLLVDLSEPGREPQTQPQSQLPPSSQLQFTSHSYPHSQVHPRPLPQTSSMASNPRMPLLNLQEVEWGEHRTQLSFINEG